MVYIYTNSLKNSFLSKISVIANDISFDKDIISLNEAIETDISYLKILAKFLDELTSLRKSIICIPEDIFFVQEERLILFPLNELLEVIINSPGEIDIEKIKNKKYYKNIPFEVKRSYGMIDANLFNILNKKVFLYYIINLLFIPHINLDLIKPNQFLQYKFTWKKYIPELKHLLNEWFNQPISISCEKMADIIIDAHNNTITKPKKIIKYQWEYGWHTEHGRQKNKQQNEDAYFLHNSFDNTTVIFFIADGISTSDIGEGWLVSHELKKYLYEHRKIFNNYFKKLNKLNNEEWTSEWKKIFVNFLINANKKLTDELNKELQNHENISDKLYPMSSTILLGIIQNNRGLVAYMGDTKLFIIYNDNIFQLTYPHNLKLKRLEKYLKEEPSQPFTINQDKDNSITNFLPYVKFENKKFVMQDINKKIDFIEFYLNKEDYYIIACSDGLVDCLFSGDEDFIKEKKLLKNFINIKNKKVKTIARELAKMSDEASGIDNITLIVLNNKKKVLSSGGDLNGGIEINFKI